MFVASVNIVHPPRACCDVTGGTQSAKSSTWSRLYVARTQSAMLWGGLDALSRVTGSAGLCNTRRGTQRRRDGRETTLRSRLSLTMYAWITPRNHELFNFHLEKLSARSSYYERICSIGYNSHLSGSLHLLEGIRAGAFNKRLNLSDK